MSLDTDFSRKAWVRGGAPFFRWWPLVAALFCSGSILRGAAWEGSDDFSSATVTENLWGTHNQKIPSLYTYVANGRLGVIHNSKVHAVYRVWGKKWHKIPTAACWTIQTDVFVPTHPTSGSTEFAKAGIVVTPSASSRNDLWLGVLQDFWNGMAGERVLMVDDDFSANGEGSEEIPHGDLWGLAGFRLTMAHDALRMRDTLTVARLDTGAALEQRQVVSRLYLAKAVGVAVGISGNPSWSSLGTGLGVDNWSVVENNPDPINLTVQNSISRGVVYSVAVTNLDLVNQRLTGTVALTVGTNSATLPITGSIDRNGLFVLAARGTGANRGFGCALLYDPSTGTYRAGKNTVTAPKQKAIKF